MEVAILTALTHCS